jgi:hypothetical protein
LSVATVIRILVLIPTPFADSESTDSGSASNLQHSSTWFRLAESV